MSGFIDYSSSHKRSTSSNSKSGEESTTTPQTTKGDHLGRVVNGKEKDGIHREELDEEDEVGERRQNQLSDRGKHQPVSPTRAMQSSWTAIDCVDDSQEASKSDSEGFVGSRNLEDSTQSSSLTRSTSTGSRFTEHFPKDDHQPNENEEKRGLKSSTLLFKRRSLKSPPPPSLNKTTSRTDTFRSTTSQDSLQSASSRRIPSFARRGENGETSPTIQRSPSLPSSPRSGTSMKLAPISSGGEGRKREKSRDSPTTSSSSRNNGNLELTPQDRHYICRILTK